MITAEQASEMSDGKYSTLQKRCEYEPETIDKEISLRTKSGGKSIIYTVYQNYLTNTEFYTLLKSIKDNLISKGYEVERIPHNVKKVHSFYIFCISWNNSGNSDEVI